MMTSKYIGDTVLSQSQICAGVKEVAHRLNQQFADGVSADSTAGNGVVVITVVPGGILFTADLVRELTFDLCMDVISCPHTPGDRNNSSTIAYQQNINITGQHVILVDDAIESGGTMKRIAAFLASEFEIRSLTIATLFVKPGRVDIPFTQHFAYEMASDELLVGYGLPWHNKYRNLPYVSKLVR